jgi:hypothetical protein
MRKPTGNIASLPYSIRRQLSEKLRDNKSLRAVAEWLFGVVDPETAAPVSDRWLADAAAENTGDVTPERDRALRACVMALCRYRQSAEFAAWLADEKRSTAVGQITTNLGALSSASAGGDPLQEASGISRLLLSVLGEKLELVAEGKATPEDLEVLFKSGSKLVQNVTKIEDVRQADRKLKLLEDNARDVKAKLTAVASKGGLTPDTLKTIEEAAALL